MVVHTFNTSTPEAEVDLYELEASLVYIASSKPDKVM